VRNIASVALTVGADVEKISGAAYPTGGTVAEAIQNAIATIGENMTLRRAAEVSVSEGVVGSYLHSSIADGLGKIGVIVALQSAGKKDELAALGRQIAMHVAATNPMALDPAGIDPATIAREKAVLAEKNAGKPANVLEKIIESGLKSYYKEVCLLEQSMIRRRRSDRPSKKRPVKWARPSNSKPISAMRWARASKNKNLILPPKWRQPPV
jgi:elongation factor Ts